MVKVAVIGSGIVGMTTAYRILKEIPNSHVTIISKDWSPNTTGDGSAGLLMPYCLGEVDVNTLSRWCRETYDFFIKFAQDANASQLGISQYSLYYLSEKEDEPEPVYFNSLGGYRKATASEMTKFPSKFKSGYFFTTLYVECTKFLPYLAKLIQEQGGQFRTKELKTLADLYVGGETYDLVVNCSGLGARQLVNDNEVFPIRGQVHRVRAPWLKHGIISEDHYILLNSDCVIIGGTHQENDWNLQVSEADKKFIIDGCSEIIPSLREAPIIANWVGLRPGRRRPRIEPELLSVTISTNPKKTKKVHIVHNYGHGGSGVTVSYGTAGEVTGLISKWLFALQTTKLRTKL